jgi:cell fate regulator YaaT (PSP1 superfamily)
LEEKNNHDFLSRGCKCTPQPHTRQIKVFEHSCNKLDAHDWLREIKPPDNYPFCDIVEVRFKNSRKDFFRTTPDQELEPGDIVAVEASPGHDIGIVTLTGEIVKLQLKNKKVNIRTTEFRKVYRKAKVSDIEKWVNAVKLEDDTMFRARGMASSLKLDMKISDVEYQGDRTKAIFYYTADERVDFRELIRVLADAFSVRIEMRQIGMRQEASRLGGIGSCGRELCCATWLTNFRSVSTNAARTQQLSLNPQKLAGQCSKLKCCINYETDIYIDSLRDFPDTNIELFTKKGKAFFQKMDVLRKTLCYAYADNPGAFITLTVDRVKEIQALNRRKQFPEDLLAEEDFTAAPSKPAYEVTHDLEDSLTRFDDPQKGKKKKRRKKPRKGNPQPKKNQGNKNHE